MPSKKTPTLRTKKKLQALQRQVNANDQEVQQAILKTRIRNTTDYDNIQYDSNAIVQNKDNKNQEKQYNHKALPYKHGQYNNKRLRYNSKTTNTMTRDYDNNTTRNKTPQ
ncbi:hypothetical protein P692DRAFT_201809906 [Suillus brevipes Sb2]|nr:hypothetical protein P692DRAFT_201809906 [Suillus brevipes Sb2]